MATKDKKQYIIKTFSFDPSFEDDRTILHFLDEQRNASNYIRDLILRDIKKRKRY